MTFVSSCKQRHATSAVGLPRPAAAWHPQRAFPTKAGGALHRFFQLSELMWYTIIKMHRGPRNYQCYGFIVRIWLYSQIPQTYLQIHIDNYLTL